ncbi:MAG: Holliday junction resolvase RuvX [Gemmatimonadales bacterium]|nr:Holliday junction resolvase RuvX [Gemmatimonadales bacterium]MDG2240964.1 Holliday junction resolvase RuvX [Longimicrobiales bacterium]NCG32575.1 Holliday junction resolvase RuvX [Pseudomonadota bacterium]MBT3499757.1 Holliday junction resolvase RuvX [Gemmatimonadales bacterium]MBT3775133.1 Holliday junction resolvase RuvX [Gemmatimonadales bacterium]
MRVLGVDFGEKRIGLALSDPTGTIATPLETLVRRAGKRVPFGKMESIGRENKAKHLVVGLPLGLDGNENEWCATIRDVGERLAARLGVDVAFVDERMTSVRAERAIRSIGLSKSALKDKRRIDAAAAQLILQSWLDQQGTIR